ncbi:MAG: hypothetical protein IKH54_04280 [Bacilli bacterium]|nr:hypothetical protein [Bacilli bacterium]
MAIFKLDCETVTSAANSINSISSQVSSYADTVKGYDTNTSDFDFSSVKSLIASNIDACAYKMNNTTKLINSVVDAHTSLQNKLIGKDDSTSSNKRRSGSSSYSSGRRRASSNISNNTDTTPDKGEEEVKKEEKKDLFKDVTTKISSIVPIAITSIKISDDKDSSSNKLFNNIDYRYQDNIARVGDNYVIECDESLGKVGDRIVFTTEDGKEISCIIGSTTKDQGSVVKIIQGEESKEENDLSKILNTNIKSIKNYGQYDFEATQKIRDELLDCALNKGVDISKMFDNEDSNWINEYIDLCAQKSGYSDYQKLPDFKKSNDGVEYFKSVGSFKDASYTPVIGDIVFYDTDNDGIADSNGIVSKILTNGLSVIEVDEDKNLVNYVYNDNSIKPLGYGVPYYGYLNKKEDELDG